MPRSYLTTSMIAKDVGVHPNTVRLYEKLGLLMPARRTPAGYRQFRMIHVYQMRLARTAFKGLFPGRSIHRSAVALVRQSASGDLGGALESAYRHLALVQSEQAQAETAVALLQRWAEGAAADATAAPLQIKDAARLLGLSTDILRNWERNHLLRVPRNPANGYRLYGPAEIGRMRVIRMLSRAGYSIMAILRMMTHLDQGRAGDLRQVLDTPRPDEDVYSAADHWLTTLAEQEARAREMIAILEEMIRIEAE